MQHSSSIAPTPLSWFQLRATLATTQSGFSLGTTGRAPGLPGWPGGTALAPHDGQGGVKPGYTFSSWLCLDPACTLENVPLFTATDGMRALTWSLGRYAQAEAPRTGAGAAPARYVLRMTIAYHKHEPRAVQCTTVVGREVVEGGKGRGEDPAVLVPGTWHHVAVAHEWAPHSAGSILTRGLAGAGLLPRMEETSPLLAVLDGVCVYDGKARYPNLKATALVASGQVEGGAAAPLGVAVCIGGLARLQGSDTWRDVLIAGVFEGQLCGAALLACALPLHALQCVHRAGQTEWPLPISPRVPLAPDASREQGSAASTAAAAVEEGHKWLLFALPAATRGVGSGGPLGERSLTRELSGDDSGSLSSSGEAAAWDVPALTHTPALRSCRVGDAVSSTRMLGSAAYVHASVSSGITAHQEDGGEGRTMRATLGDARLTPPVDGTSLDRACWTHVWSRSAESTDTPVWGLRQAYGPEGGPCAVLQLTGGGASVSCGVSAEGESAWTAYRSHDAAMAGREKPPPHWMASVWQMQASGDRGKLTSADGAAPPNPSISAAPSAPVPDRPTLAFTASDVDLLRGIGRAGTATSSVVLSPYAFGRGGGTAGDRSRAGSDALWAPAGPAPVEGHSAGTSAWRPAPALSRQHGMLAGLARSHGTLNALPPQEVEGGVEGEACVPFETHEGEGGRGGSETPARGSVSDDGRLASATRARQDKPSAESTPLCHFRVHSILPLVCTPGTLELYPDTIVFVPESIQNGAEGGSRARPGLERTPSPWASRKAYMAAVLPPAPPVTIPLAALVSMERRAHRLRQLALELFYTGSPTAQESSPLSHGTASFFAFDDVADRDTFADSVLGRHPPFLAPYLGTTAAARQAAAALAARWRGGSVSNLEYLLALNRLAGRSMLDLAQYPVLPWVLADYTSGELDLDDPATFRDLEWPIGAQTSARRAALRAKHSFLKQQFDEAQAGAGELPPRVGRVEAAPGGPDSPSAPAQAPVRTLEDDQLFFGPPFHFGSLYMKPGTAAWYLMRLEPYSSLLIATSDGRFDRCDRLFHSVADAYTVAVSSDSDIRELTPEAYLSIDGAWLVNRSGFVLGTRQDGQRVGDVHLPPWAHGSPSVFSALMRQALESEYVSHKLHLWVDLVFGHKAALGSQCAVAAVNTYHALMHTSFIDTQELHRAVKAERAQQAKDVAEHQRKALRAAKRGGSGGGEGAASALVVALPPELLRPGTLTMLLTRVDAFRDEFGVLPLQLFKKVRVDVGAARGSTAHPGGEAEREAPPALQTQTPQLTRRKSVVLLGTLTSSAALVAARPLYPSQGPGDRTLRFGRGSSGVFPDSPAGSRVGGTSRRGSVALSRRGSDASFAVAFSAEGRASSFSDVAPPDRSAVKRLFPLASTDGVGSASPLGGGSLDRSLDRSASTYSLMHLMGVSGVLDALSGAPGVPCQHDVSAVEDCEANDPSLDLNTPVSGPMEERAVDVHANRRYGARHNRAGVCDDCGWDEQHLAALSHACPDLSTAAVSVIACVGRGVLMRLLRPAHGTSANMASAQLTFTIDAPTRMIIATRQAGASATSPAYLAGGGTSLRRVSPDAKLGLTVLDTPTCVTIQSRLHPALACGASGLLALTRGRGRGWVGGVPNGTPGSTAIDAGVRAGLSAKVGEWMAVGTASGEVQVYTLRVGSGEGKAGGGERAGGVDGVDSPSKRASGSTQSSQKTMNARYRGSAEYFARKDGVHALPPEAVVVTVTASRLLSVGAALRAVWQAGAAPCLKGGVTAVAIHASSQMLAAAVELVGEAAQTSGGVACAVAVWHLQSGNLMDVLLCDLPPAPSRETEGQ